MNDRRNVSRAFYHLGVESCVRVKYMYTGLFKFKGDWALIKNVVKREWTKKTLIYQML